jgi:hypothetical protein
VEAYQNIKAYMDDIAGWAAAVMTRIDAACPAAGIPRRFMRHANVGIALACCICLNKPDHSRPDIVFLG